LFDPLLFFERVSNGYRSWRNISNRSIQHLDAVGCLHYSSREPFHPYAMGDIIAFLTIVWYNKIVRESHREILTNLGRWSMLKRFAQNPVGWLVFAIIVLAFVSYFLPTMVIIACVAAALITLVFIGRFILKRWGGGSHNGGAYCTHCPHPDHGRQACGLCRCAHS